MMTRALPLIALSLTAILGWPPASGAGQSAQPAQAAQPSAKSAVTALMVDIVISRYQGEKRLSNMPYTLAVNTDNSRSSLRMGGEVPIPSTTFQPKDSKEGAPPNPLTSYSYRSLGTNIDVNAVVADDGRYKLTLLVEDSSVYADLAKSPEIFRVGSAPSFRIFRTNNSLTMRNGQMVEFTAATDRIGGEVVKVSVKMTVLN